MTRLLPILALSGVLACSASEDPEEALGCLSFQACGEAANGESCGACDDHDPCTEDRCVLGHLCNVVPRLDECSCVGKCLPEGSLARRVGLANGQGGLEGLRGVRDVVVAGGGRHVYVAARAQRGTRAIIDLPTGRRGEGAPGQELGPGGSEEGTGSLSLLSEHDGRYYRAMLMQVADLRALALSPDEETLVIGYSGGLIVTHRDPETGALAPVSELSAKVEGLVATGSGLIAAGDGAVTRFSLTDAGLVERDRADGGDLAGAHRVVLSAGGRHAYVVAFEGGTLTGWDVESSTLDRVATQLGSPGLDRPDDVAITPDGLQVLTAGFCDQTIGIFARDPASGQLSFSGSTDPPLAAPSPGGGVVDCPNALDFGAPGVAEAQQTGHPGALGVSPDGARIWMGSRFGSHLTWFDRADGVLTRAGEVEFLPAYSDFSLGGFGASPLVGWPGVMRGLSRMAVTDDRVLIGAYLSNSLTVLSHEGQVTQQLQQGDGGIRRLAAAYNLDLSPDGRHLYVAARNDGEVASFAVDPDGGLTEISWPSERANAESGGLTNVVVARPDGLHAYAVDSQFGTLRSYERDPATGALTPLPDRVLPKCGGQPSFPVDVVSSHDGTSLYVADFQLEEKSCLIHLPRAADGTLGKAVTWDSANLHGIEAVVLTPDDEHLYAVAHFAGAVTHFARGKDGTLVQKAVTKHEALTGAEAIALSPDLQTIYASSPVQSSLVALDRADDGSLSVRQVIAEHDGEPPIREAAGIAVSPDSGTVWLASRSSDTITTWSVGPDGHLNHVRTTTDAAVLDWATGIVVSADGRTLFATAVLSSAVSSWRISVPGEDGCGGTCP